jgi:hypothetical protein
LAHFNLEHTTVERGKRYALPQILEHGFLDAEGHETLPKLSFEDIYIGECLAVSNNIPYEALAAIDFEYSFIHIKNIDDLKRSILRRYQKSKPDLTRDDLLAQGVSRMLLVIKKAH